VVVFAEVGAVVVEAPGVLVLGVLVAGALVAGVLALGVLVVGMLTPGVVVLDAGGIAVVGAVVIVLTIAVVVEPESPVSCTTAAASTPSDSAATLASTAIGIFQLGVAARRVRAAAPQFRHHSCSGCSGAPHSGQASPAVVRVGVPAGAPPGATGPCAPPRPPVGSEGLPVGCAGGEATVTSRPSAGG
jgi:hypothetical protein